jgi:hypothetical protein
MSELGLTDDLVEKRMLDKEDAKDLETVIKESYKGEARLNKEAAYQTKRARSEAKAKVAAKPTLSSVTGSKWVCAATTPSVTKNIV